MGLLNKLLRALRQEPEASPHPVNRQASVHSRASTRAAAASDDATRLLDLRHLESTPLRLRGIAHYVSERGRSEHGGSMLVLRREPSNPHDSFAIAVYGPKGRKLGHVSASRAAQLTPLLDRLGHEGYIVAGIVEQVPGRMTQLHVMLPRIPVLRAWVQQYAT